MYDSHRALKFGVEVPRSPRHATQLDQINGTNAWKEAIGKELLKIDKYETFRVPKDDEYLPPEFQKIPYHLVFNVKFNLGQKARLVAGGKWTDPPKEDVYSGVVLLDTVRLGFAVTATNGLTICAADVSNAFLYGKTKERTYVIAGMEFGSEVKGKCLVIHKGLYGLHSSAARFHEHLGPKLWSMGFYRPR
jgi:hypothetical protein